MHVLLVYIFCCKGNEMCFRHFDLGASFVKSNLHKPFNSNISCVYLYIVSYGLILNKLGKFLNEQYTQLFFF